MRILTFFITIFLVQNGWAQKLAQGPSNLEKEFLKQADIKMPMIYSDISGLSFDFSIQKDEVDETKDDLYADFTGLSVNIGPIFYGSFEKTKRLVSQEQSPQNSFVIETSTRNSPYLKIENKKWDLAGGLEVYAVLPPAGLIGLSVAGLKSKNYYSIRNLKRKDEERSELLLPVNAENLRTWKVNDQIFYASSGGVVFNLFLGLRPFISLGPEYIHSGSYRIKAHLINENTMEIEVTTTKTNSIGIEALNLPHKIEMSKGKGHAKSMIYTFDMRNPNAFKAISYLFKGRCDLTNLDMLNSNGKITLTTQIEHTYASISGMYGIPFLYTMGGNFGYSRSEGIIEREEDGKSLKYEIFSASSVREHYTRGLFSRHKWLSKNINSTVVRDLNGDDSIITAFFSWSFSKDKMNKSLLQKKYQQLNSIFGLPRINQLVFPAKRMGYLKTDFNINFSGSDILYLLNTDNLEFIKVTALAKVTSDFEKQGHHAFCKVRTYKGCLYRHRLQIIRRYEDMSDQVKEINSLYEKNEIHKMTVELSKLIKTLFLSRYLTRAFADAREDLEFELRLEGENIKKHVISL